MKWYEMRWFQTHGLFKQTHGLFKWWRVRVLMSQRPAYATNEEYLVTSYLVFLQFGAESRCPNFVPKIFKGSFWYVPSFSLRESWKIMEHKSDLRRLEPFGTLPKWIIKGVDHMGTPNLSRDQKISTWMVSWLANIFRINFGQTFRARNSSVSGRLSYPKCVALSTMPQMNSNDVQQGKWLNLCGQSNQEASCTGGNN